MGTKKRVGRPKKYTPEIAAKFCKKVATTTQSIKHICASEEFPHHDTINEWLWEYKDFSDQYIRAKAHQQLLMAEEIREIADDGFNDWMEIERRDGRVDTVPNHEHIRRSEVRIATRQWIAERLAPKIFGKRPEDLSLEVSAPINLRIRERE